MIEQYLGFSSDYIILGLAAIVIILLILLIVIMLKVSKLGKRLDGFMKGKDGKSLENTLIYRLEQIDDLRESNQNNERNIDVLKKHQKFCFSKMGLEKYNALDELGGNLSFALALLNENDDGFIVNVVHTREGCYTYMKELIDGNSVIGLSEEEQKALDKAMNTKEK